MRKGTLVRSASVLALGLLSGMAMAGTTLTVDIEGPGGHSNGDYGNVNAVHAASRAAMNIEKTVPQAVISHIKGGNSVNSIAADAHFKVMLNGKDVKGDTAKVKEAVMQACAAENAFRGVKAGQKDADGLGMDVRCSVK